MGFGMDMAAGAANGLLGQVGGMIFGKAQDRRQLKQQEKLQKLQIAGNKEMLDYSNAAQREMQMKMWEDTNLPAQVEQAKKAGMSIASLYGGSGAGGATTGGSGASGSVSGAMAGDPNAGVGMGLQMASQLALMKAQKENIEADTANKKAGAENTGAQTEGTKIDNTVKQETKEATIQTIKERAFQQLAETGISEQNRSVGAETINDRITKIKQEAIGEILNNEATKSGIKLNNERINEIANSIQQRWKDLELQGKGLEVSKENMEKLTEAMLWGAGIQATGNIVKGIVDIATKSKGSSTRISRNSGDGWSTETRSTTNH